MTDLVVKVALELPEEEAMALAQFVKRAYRDVARQLAGDEQEADAIVMAWMRLRQALAEAGYAPR